MSMRTGSLLLSEQAAERIIRYIQDNRMQKEDRLPNEKDLMEMLSVSRSTIREAMRSLSSRGIVVIRQGSGTYISNAPGVPEDPLGLEFQYDKRKVISDMLDLRLIMEPSIAAQAARRASKEDCEELLRLASLVSERIAAGIDHLETDIAFHNRVAAATGNDILKVLFPEIAKGIRQFTTMLGDRIIREVADDHMRVARAIADRDTQRAYTAMLMHLERNRIAIEKLNEDENKTKESER